MIEEQGRVIDVTADQAWVQTIKSSTCAGCKAKKGCGHHLLAAGKGSGEAVHIRVPLSMPLQVGDQVTIGIPEQALISAALWVYGLPMLLLFVGAALGQWLPVGDYDGALWGGLLGLLVGFVVNRWRARHHDCAITVLRVLSDPSKVSRRIGVVADNQG